MPEAPISVQALAMDGRMPVCARAIPSTKVNPFTIYDAGRSSSRDVLHKGIGRSEPKGQGAGGGADLEKAIISSARSAT